MTVLLHLLRLRFTTGRLLVILSGAFFVFLGSRHLTRLPAENDLLREPAVLLMFGLLLVFFLFGLVVPRKLSRAAPRLLPLCLLASIVANAVMFTQADPSTRISSFHVRTDAKLSSLGKMPGWVNHWSTYDLYTYLHDHMRDSTIVTYEPAMAFHPNFGSVLHPVYLKYMAEIQDLRTEEYDTGITARQADWLLGHPHATFEDFSTKIEWTIVETPGPTSDTYRVLIHDNRHFLIRESLLQAVYAQ